MQDRKGQQEGTNVAVLVALLAMFILAYVILLPPDERDKLLNEDFGVNGNNGNGNGESLGDLLISETPGVLRPFADESIKHKLAPIDLFVREEPESSEIVPSLYIERNLFSDRKQSINFNLDEQEGLKVVELFFTVRDARGRLIVSLNGNEIFNEKIEKGNIARINLPLHLLDRRNAVTFATSYTLFGSNRYNLGEINLRKEFSLENVKVERTFVLSQDEFNRITRVRLNYFISCLSPEKEVSNLRIEVNAKPFESINLPCVGDEVTFDVDKDDLQEGRNRVSFSIDDGDFRFTDLEIEVELDERVFPTYNFVVDEDQINDIEDDDVDAVLRMSFLDDRKRKQAEIFINGNRLFLDTTGDEYSKDIGSFLEEGSNELKLIAVSQFEVTNLQIKLE